VQIRNAARTGLALVAGLFAIGLIVQIFLAGLGVFDGPSNFETHRSFGYTIGLLTIVMIVLALIGRVPRPLLGLSVLTLVQMFLQSVLVGMRESNPAIAALHPVNGVLLLIVTLVIARQAWAIRDEPAPAAQATPATASGPESPTIR
jgi:cytochrome b561